MENCNCPSPWWIRTRARCTSPVASVPVNVRCLTTGNMLMTSSSPKVGLCRESNVYSLSCTCRQRRRASNTTVALRRILIFHIQRWQQHAWFLTWMPVLVAISLSREVLWRPCFSMTSSILSLKAEDDYKIVHTTPKHPHRAHLLIS